LKADSATTACDYNNLVGHVSGDFTDATFEVFLAWEPAHFGGSLYDEIKMQI